MKHISILLRFYGVLICLFGLGYAISPVAVFPPDEQPSLWCRIAGLHLAAMGAYLAILQVSVHPALVRKLMALRVSLGAAEMALGVSQGVPLFTVLGAVDLVVSGVLFSSLRVFAEKAIVDVPLPSKWRRVHDVALQVPPTVEALLGIFAPLISVRFLFGADVIPEDHWLRFSAFQCAYLAGFWWFVTRAGASRAIVATAWGRSLVATAFLVYATNGMAPPDSHLPWLAGGLFLSVGATVLVRRFGGGELATTVASVQIESEP